MVRVRAMNARLKKIFPRVKGTALAYKTPWQLLVVVILSAQCTDKKVNEITPLLFKKLKTPADFVRVRREELEVLIRQTGFYRAKAKNIQGAAVMVQQVHKGKVPNAMKELLKLPGVARKTANVVLGNAFGIVEGIAVDTHVLRFSARFDLSDYKEPTKIERDLMRMLPRKEWFGFSNRLIAYGRTVCPARPHPCEDHPLTKVYPPAAHCWPKTK